MESIIRRVQWKTRKIRELHTRLKQLVPAQEDRLTYLLHEKEKTLMSIKPELEHLYSWTQTQHSTLIGYRRFIYSQFVSAITWINIDEARKYASRQNKLWIKGLKAMKTGIRFKEILQFYTPAKIMKTIANMMASLSDAISYNKSVITNIIDHETASVFSPLARIVFRNTLFYYTRGTREGARIGVIADLGGGKTTFAYLSIYAVLRTIGINAEDAVQYTHALLTNDPIEWVKIMKYVTIEDVYAPAIIADDIPSMVGKHWILEGTHVRGAVLKILKALKISREGFGAVIFPADAKDALTKSIRESLDIEYVGEPERMADRIGTIWIDKDLKTVLAKKMYRATTIRSKPIMETICATTHPPLLIPPAIYSTLEKQKKKARAQWLQEAENELTKALLSMPEKKKQKKEEATIEEAWGI